MSDLWTASEPRTDGRRNLSVVLLTAALVLLLIAAGVLAWLGHEQLRTVNRSFSSVREAQARLERQLSTSGKKLLSIQSQLAGLSTQASATQSQLRLDEKKIKAITGSLPPDVPRLAEQVLPSVVQISCADGLGTGFAFDIPAARGYSSVVVTAGHVVVDCVGEDSPQIVVTQNQQDIPAHLRSVDSDSDVAVIDLEERLPELKPAAGLSTGEFVMAVGNPLGVTGNVTQGNVSRITNTVIYNTAPISNGNSGGPIIDKSGRVLGISDKASVASDYAPVVENLNEALRLSNLCAQILDGPACSNLP